MQHILITGGNAGIGKSTATALAHEGNKVILASRDVIKARTAAAEIKKVTGNNEIYFVPCDLSSLNSVRSCAQSYRKDFGKLDILINNAGVVSDKLLFTNDGFELHIGVNHLGHFLLTNELLELLLNAPQARIINVSSNAHFYGKINFDSFMGEVDLSKSSGMAFYSQSKLANVLFTKELAKRYPTICSHSLTPGVVRTEIAQKNGNKALWKMAWKLFSPFMLSPEKGAETSVYLALEEEPLRTNGKYYNKKKEIRPSKRANDQKLAQELWEVSQELIS